MMPISSEEESDWTPYANQCTRATLADGSYVPKTPETFTYDADGNLTQDERWNYVWDAENRLVAVESSFLVGDDVRSL